MTLLCPLGNAAHSPAYLAKPHIRKTGPLANKDKGVENRGTGRDRDGPGLSRQETLLNQGWLRGKGLKTPKFALSRWPFNSRGGSSPSVPSSFRGGLFSGRGRGLRGVAVKSNLCWDVNPYPESNGSQIVWNVWNVPGEGGGGGQGHSTNERQRHPGCSPPPLRAHTPPWEPSPGPSQAYSQQSPQPR